MRRHERLQPLSREHHHTLKIARRLQRGEPDDALHRELAEHRRELAAHFEAEESIGRQARAQCPEDTTLAGQLDRMQHEHRQIEALLTEVLEGACDQGSCHRLGALLVAHVRFEERVLFNHLQEGCLPGQVGESV
ncbi:hemerythrin domain-containing protein [Guyparkeria halophila]|uniref:Hemerythrin domain-containing protein n=1 Tax=Guyparkeria halophila TaxID=47960 RepID=A0ABZ0Z117_9GAMM|nr:hemerythrin domain-containing protein [Guyparkeria halophila]WQH17122.1 hemerythrin domain-containing protein [Guyparkeria halophila]